MRLLKVVAIVSDNGESVIKKQKQKQKPTPQILLGSAEKEKPRQFWIAPLSSAFLKNIA